MSPAPDFSGAGLFLCLIEVIPAKVGISYGESRETILPFKAYSADRSVRRSTAKRGGRFFFYSSHGL